MKSFIKIHVLLLFLIFVNHCEKTIYYQDKNNPSFINLPNFSKLKDTSAEIYWLTDDACNCNFLYSFYDNQKQMDTIFLPEFREKHKLTLNNLWPNIRYFCYVEIFDFEQNGPVISDTLDFRTISNGLSEAWDELTNNNLENAETIINNWSETQTENPEILFTQAWIIFRQGKIIEAENIMTDILYKHPDFLLNLSGLVVINHLQQEFDEVKKFANLLLNEDASWVFVYTKADLNYKYIRLMLSEAYLNTGYLDKAQKQLDLVWPDNRLDPDISSSWIINNINYQNYESALIALIDYLYKIL